jgi:hypothetical protein
MIRRIAMLLAGGLVATVTACGTPASPAASPASTSPTGSGAPRATVAPSSAHCTAHVTAGDSANGSTVCVVQGSDVTLILHTTAGAGWSTPEVTGDALGSARPVPTPAGSAGWSFPAVAAGTADVSTSRPVCPPAGSGAMRCHSMILYELHVEVG